IPACGHVDAHPLDGFGRRQTGISLGLLGDRLVDSLFGLLVERHGAEPTHCCRYATSAAQSTTEASLAMPHGGEPGFARLPGLTADGCALCDIGRPVSIERRVQPAFLH